MSRLHIRTCLLLLSFGVHFACAADSSEALSALMGGRTALIEEVFATAPVDDGVPQLQALGATQQKVAIGGEAIFTVQGAPAAAVTFGSRDGGRFDNGMDAVRVLADSRGIARVRVRAAPGAVGDITILVGSVAAAGTVPLILSVIHPGSARTPRVSPAIDLTPQGLP
jgi:hypothetical protein